MTDSRYVVRPGGSSDGRTDRDVTVKQARQALSQFEEYWEVMLDGLDNVEMPQTDERE